MSVDSLGPALEEGGKTWSYRELAQVADAAAGSLKEVGVGPGDRVGLLGGLNRRSVAALHGVWRAGASVFPLNPGWTAEEMRRALDALPIRALLVDGDGLGPRAFAGIPPGVEIHSLDRLPEEGHRSERAGVFEAPAGEVAWLLTSGTSGTPLPVGVTFQNLVASATGARARLDLDSADSWLASLSPSHIGGLALVTRAALLGSRLVLTGPFQVDTFLTLIREGAVTHASLVPTMLGRVVEAWGQGPLPSTVRCLLIGGAPTGPDLLKRALDRGFPLALSYGLSQATSQVATAPPGLVREKPGTVGLPLPGVQVSLADTGELLVRGPTVVPGHAAADGWLRTGDLARMDVDGHLWIEGRLSDRVITGGVNVDPGEVEAMLEAHPDVTEAVVLGVADEEWGERVVAVVVCRAGVEPSPDDLAELVRSRLSPPKRPREFRFVDAIPRNPNGKVDRDAIRALFR